MSQTQAVVNHARPSEFNEFIRYADETELLRERQLLISQRAVMGDVRSHVTEIIDERIAILTRTLGLN